jgi:two-component sensor histidine kinase
VPSFFASAPDAPEVIQKLWSFAEAAYLNNPIPSLLKERLFVYLSRFCEVRYCLIRHCAFLLGHGNSAGDRTAKAQTPEEVIRLLKTAPPWRRDDDWLQGLESHPIDPEWPDPETETEHLLFQAATLMFTEPARSERARIAVRRLLGGKRFEYLTALLAFIRTAHYWTLIHPDLPLEGDAIALLEANDELASLILHDPEASRADMGGRLFAELEDLRGLHERAELERAKAALERALAQKDLLLKEVNHRVRNSLQIASSILQLEATPTADLDGVGAVQRAAARVLAIAAVHEGLYTGDDVTVVALDQLLGRMCRNLANALGCPDGVETRFERVEIPTDMAIPIALIVNELVTNAIKFAGPPCRVSLQSTPNGRLTVTVSDSGVGPRPGGQPGTGLGSRIMEGLAQQLGGAIQPKLHAAGYDVRLDVPVKATLGSGKAPS